jgi:hypothetical protein
MTLCRKHVALADGLAALGVNGFHQEALTPRPRARIADITKRCLRHPRRCMRRWGPVLRPTVPGLRALRRGLGRLGHIRLERTDERGWRIHRRFEAVKISQDFVASKIRNGP